MRTRWIIPVVAIVVVIGAVLVIRAGADGGSTSGSSSPQASGETATTSAGLPSRALTAGAVDVSIEPVQIDGAEAVFRVVMDTHSEELSADLATTAQLEVDGVLWTGATWSGDPPGGHHREGELSFQAASPASGSVVLSIGGFSAPVEASWTLGA